MVEARKLDVKESTWKHSGLGLSTSRQLQLCLGARVRGDEARRRPRAGAAAASETVGA